MPQPLWPANAKTLALFSSLDVCCQSRALLSRFVSVLSLIWLLNPRKLRLLLPLRSGGHKNRRKAQIQPQLHSAEELSSPDERSALNDVIQALGTLTTALATTNAKMDSVTQHGVHQVATAAIQSRPRCLNAVENPPTATSSAEPEQASLEDQVWLWVEHRRRASLDPTDDEETREEEKQP